MDIPDKTHFQPGSESLKKWLSTRKPTLEVSGLAFPGFFSEHKISRDTTMFWIAFTIEVLGLSLITFGGLKSKDFMAYAISSAILFFFLDIFFALKLHRNKGEICLLNSKKLLIDEYQKKDLKNIEDNINDGKISDVLLKLGIIFIALLKTFAIVLLGVFNHPMIYIIFLLLFILVAYIHINHTGYYWLFETTKKSIKRDYDKFGDGQFAAKTPYQDLHTPTALKKIPVKHNPHEINLLSEENNEYRISTIGILTDSDIINLITGQEDANKIALFKACRKLQIENIEGSSEN